MSLDATEKIVQQRLSALQSFIHAAFSNYTHEYYICNTFRKPAPVLKFLLLTCKILHIFPFLMNVKNIFIPYNATSYTPIIKVQV
jgi:hypothetical protein